MQQEDGFNLKLHYFMYLVLKNPIAFIKLFDIL